MCSEGQFWLGQVAMRSSKRFPCIYAENGLQGESTAKWRLGGEEPLKLHRRYPLGTLLWAAGSPVTWERQGRLTRLESLASSSRFSWAPELGKQQNATSFLLLHSTRLETLFSLMAR